MSGGRASTRASPDESLAALVVDNLVARRLLSKARAREVLAKLVSGTATVDDWRLWIELAPDEQAPGGKNASD